MRGEGKGGVFDVKFKVLCRSHLSNTRVGCILLFCINLSVFFCVFFFFFFFFFFFYMWCAYFSNYDEIEASLHFTSARSRIDPPLLCLCLRLAMLTTCQGFMGMVLRMRH